MTGTLRDLIAMSKCSGGCYAGARYGDTWGLIGRGVACVILPTVTHGFSGMINTCNGVSCICVIVRYTDS